jgi:hypothetical protein
MAFIVVKRVEVCPRVRERGEKQMLVVSRKRVNYTSKRAFFFEVKRDQVEYNQQPLSEGKPNEAKERSTRVMRFCVRGALCYLTGAEGHSCAKRGACSTRSEQGDPITRTKFGYRLCLDETGTAKMTVLIEFACQGRGW